MSIKLNDTLVVKNDPRSTAAEAFRALRTNIQFMNPDQSLKSIVITSACPGEGKTTLVANLAISMAQLGKKVVCVDTDLRKPALHKAFNILNMKEINALAVPGGWVYVTKGLMEVPLSEDELGFVLAHEVTHIAQRHGAKQMEKSLGLSLVVGLVTRSSDARLAARVVSMLLESGYSRKDEYRADAGGCSSLMQLAA